MAAIRPIPDGVELLESIICPVTKLEIFQLRALLNTKVHSHFLSNFQEVDLLGCGGFAVVSKCQNQTDLRSYAVKKCFLTTLAEPEPLARGNRYKKPKIPDLEHVAANFKAMVKEVEILCDLQHDNVVRFFSSWPEKHFTGYESDNCSIYKDYPCLYIQLECCDSSLEDRLKTYNAWITEREISETFSDIVRGLNYIHTKGIMHGDLRPPNILYKNGTAKLADFGLARRTGEEIARQPSCNLYGDPEMVEKKAADPSLDIHALGIMLFEMLQPVGSRTERIQVLSNLKKDKEFPLEWKTNGSLKELMQHVLEMIDENRNKRPTAAHLMEKLDDIKKLIQISKKETPSLVVA